MKANSQCKACGFSFYCPTPTNVCRLCWQPPSDTDPYNVTFHGHKLDPYQIGVLFGITHPALFQILKKVLRSGRKHKDLAQDVAEIISSAVRWQEMEAEDKSNQTE